MGEMRINKRGYPVAIGIFIIAIVLAFTLKNDYYLVILCQIACYYVAALGLNFITGLSGQSNMGAAGIFSVGAYASALISMKLGVSPFLAIIPVLGVGWLVGKLLGYPTLRLEGVYLALTSMLFAEVIRIAIMNTDFTGGAAGLKNIPNYYLFGYTLSSYRQMVVFYSVVALFMSYLAYRIIRSRWGRSFVAIRDNVEAVEACGIKVSALKITAFTICCVFTCIGGAMYSHYTNYLSPASFNGLLSSSFVIMLIIGGFGTVSGAFAGAVFVILLPELLRFVGTYYILVYVTIVLLCIFFLPGGIVPSIMRVKGRIKTKDLVNILFGTGKKGDGKIE